MSKLFSIRCPQRGSSIVTLLLLISFSVFVSSQKVEKKICQTKECLAAAKNFKESMNFDADPCDDFYKYACGNWSQSSNESRSIILSRQVELAQEILDFLKQNNSKDEPEAVHKARKAFSLCMNEEAYSKDLTQIDNTLQKIGLPVNSLVSNKTVAYDYTKALAKAASLVGINLYFNIEVLPNALNQTEDTITISLTVPESDSLNSTIDEKNRKFEEIKRMCGNNTSPSCKGLLALLTSALNATAEEIEKQKSDVSSVGTESESLSNSSIPVQYNLKQLQNLTDEIAAEVNSTIPTLNWAKYIEELLDDDNVTTNFSDPNKLQIIIEDLSSVEEMLWYIHKKQNIKTIAYELVQEVIYTLQPYVDSTGKTEKKCGTQITSLFDWAVSYRYAVTEKYIKAKPRIRTMFEHLRESFQQLLQQAPWMDEKTKQRAIKKLRWMRSFIAYPSIIANASTLDDIYKDVQVTNNYYDLRRSLYQNLNLKMKKNRRDDDWTVSPNVVNAMYAPRTNGIYILAGILGFPFYNNDALYALNYGVIGSIVGHEMAHAFDNDGRDYNETGHIEDWWQPETAKLYKDKAKCFVQANRNSSATSKQTVFNSRNLGEDLADNVGFKESLLAYRKGSSVYGDELSLPGFENFTHEQLLTMAYANVWCETPSSASSSSGFDVHSAAEVRANGVLRNSKEFSEIWKCPKGSKMNPVEKCELW